MITITSGGPMADFFNQQQQQQQQIATAPVATQIAAIAAAKQAGQTAAAQGASPATSSAISQSAFNAVISSASQPDVAITVMTALPRPANAPQSGDLWQVSSDFEVNPNPAFYLSVASAQTDARNRKYVLDQSGVTIRYWSAA